MWLSMEHGLLRLSANAPVAFRAARGRWVECVDGRLWLTITGQPGDFLLAAGDRLRIDSDGLAVIEGFPTGTLRLHPAYLAKKALASSSVATSPRSADSMRWRTTST